MKTNFDISILEQGEYYVINNTKKVMYWDGEKWMKPQKDTRGSYSGWITPIEKQPKNIKSAINVKETDLYYLYKLN